MEVLQAYQPWYVLDMLQRYMASLFRAKNVTLTLVVEGSPGTNQPRRLRRIVPNMEDLTAEIQEVPLSGLVGTAVTAPERSFSVQKPQEDKNYDASVDLAVETKEEVLHMATIRPDVRDGTTQAVLAVMQWRSDVSHQIFGDDGLYKISNMRHRDVLEKVCSLLRVCVQRWRRWTQQCYTKHPEP